MLEADTASVQMLEADTASAQSVVSVAASSHFLRPKATVVQLAETIDAPSRIALDPLATVSPAAMAKLPLAVSVPDCADVDVAVMLDLPLLAPSTDPTKVDVAVTVDWPFATIVAEADCDRALGIFAPCDSIEEATCVAEQDIVAAAFACTVAADCCDSEAEMSAVDGFCATTLATAETLDVAVIATVSATPPSSASGLEASGENPSMA